MSNSGTYLVKTTPAMLERWHEEAARRGIPLSQLIREAVNKEIERGASARPPTIFGHDQP